MLCIINTSHEPYFNMALEEYLLKHFTEDIFMLWRNENAIVVGKHQNTLAEINYDYVRRRKIKVVRRLSGGGTVFHDLGNLNFTFIKNAEGEDVVNFRKFTQPILEVLKSLGVEARFEGKNDLKINGFKFSGNAEHVYRKRVLHHGTMLFSSRLSELSEALKVKPDAYVDKAVKSNRSEVTNIVDYLKEKISIQEFENHIIRHIQSMYADFAMYNLTESDIFNVERLRDEKYSKWEWNYAYSPPYFYCGQIEKDEGILQARLNVKDGIILKAEFRGNLIDADMMKSLEQTFTGIEHHPEELLSKFFAAHRDFGGLTAEDILKILL